MFCLQVSTLYFVMATIFYTEYRAGDLPNPTTTLTWWPKPWYHIRNVQVARVKCKGKLSFNFLGKKRSLSSYRAVNTPCQWLRWSRGSVLAFGTQVRGFAPGRSRWIFRAKKILNLPSFGGEVKPSVPFRSSTACKRSLNVTCKSAFRQNSRTFLAHSSTFRRWVLSCGDTRGDAWWRKLERLTLIAQ